MLVGFMLQAQIAYKIEEDGFTIRSTNGLDTTDIQGQESYDWTIEKCELNEYAGEYIWAPLFVLAAGIAGFMGEKVPKRLQECVKTWAVYLVSGFKNKNTF